MTFARVPENDLAQAWKGGERGCGLTLYRKRPLSTKTQCNRSPKTWCTRVAATVLSTPPDNAHMTWSSGPTCSAKTYGVQSTCGRFTEIKYAEE